MHTAIVAAETVCVLNLIVLLISKLHGEKTHPTSAAFIACLGLAVFGVGMDLLSYVLEGTSDNAFLLVVVNMFSFLGYDFELAAFSVYIWTMVAEKGNGSRGFVRFIICICLADILFVVVGTISGQLFSIQNGAFVTGPLYNFGGVMGFIVLVSLLIFAVKNRKDVGNTPFIFVVIFFVITYTSIFVTLFTGIDSYMYVCMSLVMLLVYIILQTGEIEHGQIRERIILEMSTTDVLTGLNNRRAFENRVDELQDHTGVGAIFCDINGLKTTNDNQGHAAGDALLQHFAELLREQFSFSDIFRISGDEFVVLQPDIHEDLFVSVVATLRNTISRQQDIASVGCAIGNENVLTLVSKAEKDMYADKRSYYVRHGLDRRRT